MAKPDQTLTRIREGWIKHAAAYADWLLARVVVRHDVFGAYRPDGGQYTAHESLDRERLIRHARGEIVIGAHSTSADGRCRCVSWDIDAHDDTADVDLNFRCALALIPILAEFKLTAFLLDSNGKGGYHVRIFLKKPVAVAVAWWLCGVASGRLSAAGFPPVETFPKQGELTLDRPYGNWIRLPGRHHKRDHWSRLYDPQADRWFAGEPAVKRLIGIAGDSPKQLLDAFRAANPEPAPPLPMSGRRSSGTWGPSGDRDKPSEAKVREALAYIPNHDDHYDQWLAVGLALNDWDPSAGLPLWIEYSSRSHKHDEATCRAKWDSFHPGGGLTIASIFAKAKEHGWKPAPGTRTQSKAEVRGQGTPHVNGAVPPADVPRVLRIGAGPRQPFPFTDLGNAERLVHRHGRDLHYLFSWGKWLLWDGRRWEVGPTDIIEPLAKETARSIYAEAAVCEDRDERTAIVKWARTSESRSRLESMIALAGSEPGIPVRPEALDSDPWLLNCPNGVVDLRCGLLGNHLREELITRLCPVEYDPTADCPLWESTLELVFAGKDDLIRYWQRLCGYALSGTTSEQVLPILHGSGENGKSTLVNALIGILGPDFAMKAPHDFLMARRQEGHPTELADLAGRRLVVAIETGENARINETLIKELTGSDPIRARRMREDFWQFNPTHKVMLCTNHKPVIKGTDHAIWRRIHLIPFDVKIPAGRKDKDMPRKLEEEYPGILAWCVRGCLEWRRAGGLEPPDEVMEATADYRKNEDVIARFLEECCTLHPGLREARVRASALYTAYKGWAERAGETPINQKRFGDAMTERGFQRLANNGIWYLGIGLHSDDDFN